MVGAVKVIKQLSRDLIEAFFTSRSPSFSVKSPWSRSGRESDISRQRIADTVAINKIFLYNIKIAMYVNTSIT